MSKFTRLNIQKVLTAVGMNTDQARKATTWLIKALAASLAAGETVELRGLGSLEVKERKSYKACNPKTGEPVIVPLRRRVVFRSGRELKTALLGSSDRATE